MEGRIVASNGFRFGNIFAPPWMGVTPLVGGVRDTEFDLSPLLGQFNGARAIQNWISVPPAAVRLQNILPMDADADFLVREIQWLVTNQGGGGQPQPQDLRGGIRDATGRLFTSDFVYVQDLTGPLIVPWGICKGGQLQFDFQNA